MSKLNERVAALTPEKRALLEHWIQGKRPDAAPGRIPRREPDAGPLPLSFPQQRLWFLEQLEPGHAFYNLPLASRLTGPLRVSVLERSLNEIVRRHESLRTTFASVEGRPAQVVAPEMALSLPVTDLGHLPEAEHEAEAAQLAYAEAHQPFDLAEGPLVRAALLRLSDVDHVLLLTMHHIVSDGWSMGVLLRELSALYGAYSMKRPSPLAELPVQYADFAVWQRELLKGERLEQLLSYWKNSLAEMPPVLELPADRPRPRAQVFQGASYSTFMPKSVLDGVHAVGRQADVTPFMVLLAAFKALLWRHAGQAQVVVGTPIANRTRVELEGLIGFFVNTLVLRTDLSGDPAFRALLGRVREVTLGAYAHQDMPFERLVEELQPERDLSHNPLFQVAFTLQDASGIQPDPRHRAPQFSAGTSKFDLTLCAMETADGLVLVFEYNTSLFNDTTIVSMAQNFETLLKSALADPDRRISELLLLSPDVRRRLLSDYNQTADDDVRASLIHELCEQGAALYPDTLALTFGEERLTYRELNARANQLARALREQGVGPEVLVGLCMDRSPELLVGLLGILKAGGAYLPLDPTYPRERLEYMLEDSGAALLLTQQRLLDDGPPYAGRAMSLDGGGGAAFAAYADDDPEPLASPDNLAYVIYTSGSQGRPKGAMLTHRGVCNAAEALQRVFAVEPGSRVLQFASLSFDASIFEILMALRAGATLCLAPREAILPGSPLTQLLRDERINVLAIPPSTLAELPAAALPELRKVIAVAEACPADLVARWSPGRDFYNAYGPTEVSIWAAAAECRDASVTPPIGRPIINTQAYVLDAHLEPVPNGVPGELYLGGAGISRGYLRRPGLTADRYPPDPFLGVPGARLYRTGDLVRRLPSGELQFLGRVDQQVKLRGYRIELGEIESSLLAHAAVREAAVVALSPHSGDARLAACYVPSAGSPPSVAEVRGFLRERLPDYMIPATFVPLDAFPRLLSGKLDRRALSALAAAAGGKGGGGQGPRSQTEEAVARVWAEVLELEGVGIHDDFFELGGHSLLATRVISRLNESFRIDLPLRQLFEMPTVALLAEAVEKARAAETKPRGPALVPLARESVTLPVAPATQE